MRRPWGATRAGIALVSLVCVGLLATGCSGSSDDGDGSVGTSDDAGATTDASGTGATLDCPAAEPELLVDRVPEAVAAVEAEVGGPQPLFEIDANFAFVNVIVATEESTKAVRYRWVPEQPLDVQEMGEAQGATFLAADVDYDPRRVLSCVRSELASSTIDLLEIVGSGDGTPVYTVFVTSAQGGQLAVQVSGEGQVQSVDPI
ncbi:MAG: hypothetical protein U0Q03_01925 [Acidimicrobiales bacterium]